MAVRDTLNKLENLVAKSSHLPLTGKVIIDEDDLVHLIDELRHDLPEELEHAEKIMSDRDNIVKTAQLEAEEIIKKAQKKAEHLVDENDVVVKANERARIIISQAQQQSSIIVEQAQQQAQQLQNDANNYASQVFEQLIEHVSRTFQGVQAAEAGLDQARQVLQQAKSQMDEQVYSYARAQAQQQIQPQNFQDEPNNL